MLVLDGKFNDFLENIKISSSNIKLIRDARDAVRNKIKSNFKDKGLEVPKFYMQGSYRMGTMIQSLPDVEYDIDDGVYLGVYSSLLLSEFPSYSQSQENVYDAVKNHTDSVTKKSTCIRVKYSKKYHIDLPIYIVNDGVAYLAHQDKGWIISDPKSLNDWFKDEVKDKGDDLRKVVKVIKSWKDFLNYESEVIDLSGLAITILCSNNFEQRNTFISTLIDTINKVLESLKQDFVCYKPVQPTHEDLFEGLSDKDKEDAIEKIEEFVLLLTNVQDEDNEKDACIELQKVFGERFPNGNENIKNDNYVRTTAPAVINEDGRSA